MRDIDIANLSVYLSVCPSVAFRYQIKTSQFFAPYGSRVKCAKPKQLTVKLRVAYAYMINALFLQLVASPARLR